MFCHSAAIKIISRNFQMVPLQFSHFAYFTESQRLFRHSPPLHCAPSGSTASSLLVFLFDSFVAHSWEDGRLQLELCLATVMRHPAAGTEHNRVACFFKFIIETNCSLRVHTHSARPHSIQNLSDFQWQWCWQREIVQILWERHVLLSLDSLNLLLLEIAMGPVNSCECFWDEEQMNRASIENRLVHKAVKSGIRASKAHEHLLVNQKSEQNTETL